jgi:cytidyltransferase-like protein
MSLTLGQMFGHKIKTLDELKVAIGQRPRNKKVIMCHGVFDVVHPGHMRHLLYAKSKADVLIASLTADTHIAKGAHRPHVPQDLRAANLAAFEMVDYVIVDKNPAPIENIKLIQPDFFAKGYEYGGNNEVNPRTTEEIAALQTYGGEMIFTPGDIVYSSSRLIDLAPPELRYDKLLTLMEREGITFQKLRATLAGMSSKRVHVVGDTIVDSLTRCAMIGGQTKTPTMSVLYEQRTDYVGGAGIVAAHLRAAGANVVFSTVLGEDALKDYALSELEKLGVDVRPVIDPTRPTTNKNAIVVDNYRLLKVDTLDNRSIANGVLKKLLDAVCMTDADAIVYSDFRHGMFNRRTIPALIDAIPEGVFKVADSQVASRWGNITDFKGFDLITPNEREARFALGDQDSGVRPLASGVYNAADSKLLILKLGDRGILACRSREQTELDSYFVLDSFVDRLVDAVGAGDALLAYSTLAMLVSNSPAEAAILGSMAAACECEMDGNVPVTQADLEAKLATAERHVEYA